MTVTIEGELIAPADTADLERRLMGANVLPLAEREALITNTLEQSAELLSLVTRATDPAAFAKAVKSTTEMCAQYARRLEVSKDMRLDAELQVRRSEIALGDEIRAGQARGEIGSRHDNRYTMSTTRSDVVVEKASPYDFAKPSELQGVHKSGGIYAMVDGTSAEDREAGLAAARAEGNVSRANVVRKIKEANGTAPVAEPTRTGDAKRAAKQVATFNRIINTLEANTMVIDELIRAGLDPAITDDEASRIVAGLEAFARATARVKKSLI